eukprot:222189-Prymnesium_polylepis.1
MAQQHRLRLEVSEERHSMRQDGALESLVARGRQHLGQIRALPVRDWWLRLIQQLQPAVAANDRVALGDERRSPVGVAVQAESDLFHGWGSVRRAMLAHIQQPRMHLRVVSLGRAVVRPFDRMTPLRSVRRHLSLVGWAWQRRHRQGLDRPCVARERDGGQAGVVQSVARLSQLRRDFADPRRPAHVEPSLELCADVRWVLTGRDGL